MRVSEERYSRDRERFDLALRMIHLEARTRTIKRWTGLTDDRIRKLFRSYVAMHGAPVQRHRGKPPHQIAFFVRNRDIRQHTAALAGLYAILGLLGEHEEPDLVGSRAALRFGELFCQTYETYAALNQPSLISFEYAHYLLNALRSRVELRAGTCLDCRAMMVFDVRRGYDAPCPLCEAESREKSAVKRSGHPSATRMRRSSLACRITPPTPTPEPMSTATAA